MILTTTAQILLSLDTGVARRLPAPEPLRTATSLNPGPKPLADLAFVDVIQAAGMRKVTYDGACSPYSVHWDTSQSDSQMHQLDLRDRLLSLASRPTQYEASKLLIWPRFEVSHTYMCVCYL